VSEVVVRFLVQEHQVIPEGDWTRAILYGGRGLGKTWNLCRWIITQALTYPNTKWVAVGKTWSEAQRVLVDGEGGLKWQVLGDPDNGRPSLEFAMLGGKLDSKSFPVSPGRMEMRFANGSVIFLASADKPDSLRGLNVHGAICDEVAFWDETSYGILSLGVRSVLPDGIPPRMLMATTPNGQNWFARDFITIEKPKHGVVYIGSQDPNMPPNPPPSSFANKFTAQSFRDNLVAQYEGTDLFQQEILGNVLSLKGQVYKGISLLTHTRTAREEAGLVWPTPSTADQIIVGQDLGTEHPSAFIVLARSGETWCAVKEVVVPAPTEGAWFSMIEPVAAEWHPEVIYSDWNFPQTVNAQRGRGLTVVNADKSAGSVMEGIREVQKLLSSGKLVIDIDACPTLWKELGNYRWQTNSKGEPAVPEKPVKRDDDSLDALRYAIYMVATKRHKKLLFA